MYCGQNETRRLDLWVLRTEIRRQLYKIYLYTQKMHVFLEDYSIEFTDFEVSI